VPRLDCSEAEWRMRVDLAACYRLSEMHRMAKVIWNHITARVSDEPDSILALRRGRGARRHVPRRRCLGPVDRWRSFKSRTYHAASGDPRAAKAARVERLFAAAADAVAKVVVNDQFWLLPA
jgi:hypothetical protein